MLEPKQDRLCYGEQLTPPEGFDFDSAIATSYSLDLNALLAVPIALCFRNTLDGELKGEKLALLEAIGQVKGKLKVFYQKGNISYPPKFNRLYTFLEPCLQAVVPEGGAFSSFHPKLWLLRFVEVVEGSKKPSVRYRLIVLSRNLTFDRSWDVAVTLEGKLGGAKANPLPMQQLREFLTKLLAQDKTFSPGAIMLQELEKVDWELPEHFNDFQMLIGGDGSDKPLHFENEHYDEILVVSPFLKSTGGGVAALDWLASYASDKTRILCSRAEELDAIGADKLAGWQCFAMNPDIVNGEERNEIGGDADQKEIKIQDLHAKLIVAAANGKAIWHIGSANATTAALGEGNNSVPRNTEAMLMLTGPSKKLGPQVLLKEWMPETGVKVFRPHEFSEFVIETDESQVQLIRQIVHQLISAQWQLDAKLDASGTSYTLVLKVSIDGGLSNHPVNYKVMVTVGQLDIAGIRELASEMTWECAKLSSISALIPVTVNVMGSDLEKRLIIAAKLSFDGEDMRHQQIMKELVDTPAKVLDYIRLLLQETPDKNQWLAFEAQHGAANVDFFLAGSPIFEHLLLATSRHPATLKRIQSAIKHLTLAGAVIPPEFLDLWKHFEKEIR
jgi:hypothetical protein